jgi:hypothetical protein
LGENGNSPWRWVEPDGKLAQSARYSAVGEGPVKVTATPLEPCALKKRSALRYEPRVRNAPEESGMGFDYPGNLLQSLERGSRGLSPGRAAGFRLCAFARPTPAEEGLKAMLTAALLTLDPEPSELLLGWVQESALEKADQPSSKSKL